MKYPGSALPRRLGSGLRRILKAHELALRTQDEVGSGYPAEIQTIIDSTELGGFNTTQGKVVVFVPQGPGRIDKESPGFSLKANFNYDKGDSIVLVSENGTWKEVMREGGDLSLDCPVVINEEGEACDPVLRVESDTEPNFIVVDGDAFSGEGHLRIMVNSATLDVSGENPITTIGGVAEEDVGRGILNLQGRSSFAFLVSGGYGGGGDQAFTIDTSDGKILTRVDGRLDVNQLLRQTVTTAIDYSVADTVSVVYANHPGTAATTLTITLPSASLNPRREIVIKDISGLLDLGNSAITRVASAGGTVDGAVNQDFASDYFSATFAAISGNWWRVD